MQRNKHHWFPIKLWLLLYTHDPKIKLWDSVPAFWEGVDRTLNLEAEDLGLRPHLKFLRALWFGQVKLPFWTFVSSSVNEAEIPIPVYPLCEWLVIKVELPSLLNTYKTWHPKKAPDQAWMGFLVYITRTKIWHKVFITFLLTHLGSVSGPESLVVFNQGPRE